MSPSQNPEMVDEAELVHDYDEEVQFNDEFVIDEPRNPHVLPRKMPSVTCHKCGAMGHNMRTCKGKRAADRAIPKGGNNKKAKGGKTKKNNTATNSSEIGNSSQAPQPTQPSQP